MWMWMWGHQLGPRWLPGCGPGWNWTLVMPWGHLGVNEGIRGKESRRGGWAQATAVLLRQAEGSWNPTPYRSNSGETEAQRSR